MASIGAQLNCSTDMMVYVTRVFELKNILAFWVEFSKLGFFYCIEQK